MVVKKLHKPAAIFVGLEVSLPLMKKDLAFETISLVGKIAFRVFQNLFGSFVDSVIKDLKCLFFAFLTSMLTLFL